MSKEKPFGGVFKVSKDNEIVPAHDFKRWLDMRGEKEMPRCSYDIYCEERLLHGAKPMSREDFTRLMDSECGAGEGKIG